MKIKDEKLRYAVTRKILRLLRKTNRELPAQSENEVGKILKASIEQFHIPSLQSLVNKLV